MNGKDANVEIPEEITWIAPEAFYRNETLKNVNFHLRSLRSKKIHFMDVVN